KPKRKDTQVPQPSDPTDIVADEAVHKELGDSLVRAATTASSLETEHDNETMRDTAAQTRFESISKHFNDSLLARVLELEKAKTTQHDEIASLKRRVKTLEKKNRLKTHKLKRLYKVGLTARVESSGDEESLDMFDGNVLDGEKVFVSRKNENIVKEVVIVAQVSTAATIVTITTKKITLAQALEALKNSKPKVKGVVIQEPSESIATIPKQKSQDKGKELVREKAKKEQEANIALIETWDDIQTKIDADHQLAERLQAQEQKELSDAEKATLFQQLLEKRRKHFAAKRAKEKRNKPLTQAQQRKIMCGSSRCQEIMGDAVAQTRFENI
nr:hypothetical protein [Tanacetum cinerariifolium]